MKWRELRIILMRQGPKPKGRVWVPMALQEPSLALRVILVCHSDTLKGTGAEKNLSHLARRRISRHVNPAGRLWTTQGIM